MTEIIQLERSIIPACDMTESEDFIRLVRETHDISGIGGYKIGAALVITYGLPNLVKTVQEFGDLPVIYDHQKAMTDIPDTGTSIVKAVKNAGASALIGFPESGPSTQEAWIKACQDAGLNIIGGGEMTHPRYKRSEGGYIADEGLDEMYLFAA